MNSSGRAAMQGTDKQEQQSCGEGQLRAEGSMGHRSSRAEGKQWEGRTAGQGAGAAGKGRAGEEWVRVNPAPALTGVVSSVSRGGVSGAAQH